MKTMVLLLALGPFIKYVPVTEYLMLTLTNIATMAHYNWRHSVTSNLLFTGDKTSAALTILTIWLCLMLSLVEKRYKLLFTNVLLSLAISLSIYFNVDNLLLFYILFELSLLPTILLIICWGGQPERVEAAYYFMFYTMLMSMPSLMSMIWISKTASPAMLTYSYMMATSSSNLQLVSLFVMLVFMIKMPLFLGHFWLPKAHVEAPAAGSMILAGVLLKTGGYGIIRLSNFLKDSSITKYVFTSISVVGMVLTCLICLSSVDLKQLIAFSSVSHMNFLIMGLMMFSVQSFGSGFMLMMSHGLVSSCMFMVTDFMYKRMGSRSLMMIKSVLLTMPIAAMWWFSLALLNMSFPPTLGSLSELLTILSTLKCYEFLQIFVVLYLFLSAAYSIYIYACVNHGTSSKVLFTLKPLSVFENFLVLLHVAPVTLMILVSYTLQF